MKKITYFITLLALLACSGNTNNNKGDINNQAILPEKYTETVYEGTLPCADCQGIKTTLSLIQNTDKKIYTFRLLEQYLGQSESKVFETTGKWTIIKGTQQDPKAIVYQLSVQNDDPEDPDVINYLVVDKTMIKQVDDEMNEFESKGNYTLLKK